MRQHSGIRTEASSLFSYFFLLFLVSSLRGRNLASIICSSLDGLCSCLAMVVTLHLRCFVRRLSFLCAVNATLSLEHSFSPQISTVPTYTHLLFCDDGPWAWTLIVRIWPFVAPKVDGLCAPFLFRSDFIFGPPPRPRSLLPLNSR